MKIFRILSIFIIVLLIFTISAFFKERVSQTLTAGDILKLISKKDVNTKELTFKLNFAGLVPLGTIIVEDKGLIILEGKSLRHFKGFIRALPFLSVFGIKAVCELNSYAEPEGLNAFFYQEETRISLTPVEQKKLKFDQVQHIMEGPEGEFPILPDTKDPLSLLFYLQGMKFEVGKEFEIFLNTAKTNYLFNFRVTGKKDYTFNSKNLRLWILESSIEKYGEIISEGSPIFRFWVLEDYNNMPVRFECYTRYGFFVGYLAD